MVNKPQQYKRTNMTNKKMTKAELRFVATVTTGGRVKFVPAV